MKSITDLFCSVFKRGIRRYFAIRSERAGCAKTSELLRQSLILSENQAYLTVHEKVHETPVGERETSSCA